MNIFLKTNKKKNVFFRVRAKKRKRVRRNGEFVYVRVSSPSSFRVKPVFSPLPSGSGETLILFERQTFPLAKIPSGAPSGTTSVTYEVTARMYYLNSGLVFNNILLM